MNLILSMLLSSLFMLSGPVKEKAEGISCDRLGNHLGNRMEAIKQIQQTDFDFVEEFQTLNLMGVRKATFYSCGAGNGYLIVDRGRQPELYREVPRDLWESWKISNHIDYFYQRVLLGNSMYMY